MTCYCLLLPPPQEWLNAQVHRSGSLYGSGDELMSHVTGSVLQPSLFLAYLKDKYSQLYQLAP